MTVKEAWITLLFKRFDEIYGVRAGDINTSLEDWVFALNGITAEQIKYALAQCKQDVDFLPTAISFRQLCQQWKSISDNCNSISLDKEAITTCPAETSVPALQWPSKSSESPTIVSNKQHSDDWKQRLMAMDEMQALGLTGSDRYDRMRLLLEKEGRERVTRLQAIAPKEKLINRKDWD